MARMRTVKPEFWEDEVIGSLSRDARLLFVATWNLADDEGLLRWAPEYLKANAFMYDDDVSIEDVDAMMGCIVAAGLVFAYRGGKTQQHLGYIVQFHRHQRVNRPQPSKLPPPSIQSLTVREMYEGRDEKRCHLCGGDVLARCESEDLSASLDHVVPRSKGGTDYPSNIKLAHLSCNKARCDRPVDGFNGGPAARYARTGSRTGTAYSPVDNSSEQENAQVSPGDAGLIEPFTESLTEPFTAVGVSRGVVKEGKGREQGARAAPAKRRTSAPEEFTITDQLRAWAAGDGISVDLEAETRRFLDHHRAKGSKFLDWSAAWRNWMSRTLEYGGAGTSRNGGRSDKQERNLAFARQLARENPTIEGEIA